MLDEGEYAAVLQRYGAAFRRKGGTIDERFEPVRREYERLTGLECHENAVMHHRLAIYGPPCRACGKPLRTPRARHCAACGTAREQP